MSPAATGAAAPLPLTLLEQATQDAGELRFRRRLLGVLSAGLAALVLLVALAGWLYSRDVANNAWVDHTYAAESKISALSTLVERLETARRGYLIAPQENFWRTYVETRGRLAPALDDLADFTSDNPSQVARAKTARGLFAVKLAQMTQTIERAHDGALETARTTFILDSGLHVTEQIRNVLDGMLAEEQRLLVTRAAGERVGSALLLAAAAVLATLLAALSVGVVILMTRFADDLGRSQRALRSLNMGLEDAVRERTSDLSRANEEIQRFAYIVSHDLRSPLVNVMGFTAEMEVSLETLRRQLAATGDIEGVAAETRRAIQEDIPEALQFIRSSTRKMDRLINAILKLSREGRRTLAPEPLDMVGVLQGVADSLAKLAEERGAQVHVEPGAPLLVSDRVAVEQIFSNLMENALKYPAPGRPGRVQVRGRAAGGRLVYEVQDNGRGIAPQDHERIFELFRRSGAQDTPGEGIGLAHVRALVYRLGGTIACISELGQGATFRVSLPPAITREEGIAA